MNNKPDSKRERLPWHTAFVQAMQLELIGHLDVLKFEAEVPLTAEPLRVDLIIRKLDTVAINKNIARIFRKENIVEYKSPHDYFSVRDLLKAEVYARMYAIANQGISLEDVTLTFVESRRPRTLLNYLREKRRYTIQEAEAGIYRVTGDYIPMQIIETKKLAEGENLWLKSFRSELKTQTLESILSAVEGRGLKQHVSAYLDILIRANYKAFMEVQNMAKYPSTEEILTAAGWAPRILERGIEQGIERGIEQSKERIARNLLAEGMSIEKTASVAELPVDKVRALTE